MYFLRPCNLLQLGGLTSTFKTRELVNHKSIKNKQTLFNSQRACYFKTKTTKQRKKGKKKKNPRLQRLLLKNKHKPATWRLWHAPHRASAGQSPAPLSPCPSPGRTRPPGRHHLRHTCRPAPVRIRVRVPDQNIASKPAPLPGMPVPYQEHAEHDPFTLQPAPGVGGEGTQLSPSQTHSERPPSCP